MAKQLFLNNWESVFIASVKDTPTTGTPATELDYGILRLSDGASATLINPTGGDYYVLTALKRSGSIETNIEIMRVTAVDNGTPGECRVTVSRAQEGTSAKGFVSGDFISLRATAGGLNALVATDETKTTGPASSTDNTVPRFDGTTGKVLKGSPVTVEDNGVITQQGADVQLVSGQLDANTNYIQSKTAAGVGKALAVFGDFEYGRFDASGNLGVGAGTISARVHVVSAPATAQVKWSDATSGTGTLDTAAGLSRIWSNVSLGFGTGAETYTERMRLDTSGNLDLTGRIRHGAGSDYGNLTNYWSDGTTGFVASYALTWRTGPNNSRVDRMTLDVNGNLGIGGSTATSFSANKRAVLSSTTSTDRVAYEATVLDGTNNHRVAMFADNLINKVGFDTGSSTGSYSGMTFRIEGSEKMTLDRSGNLTLNAGAFGYGAGAGGTVSQVTAKSFPVTLNKPSGKITMVSDALAAGASISFVLYNSFIADDDLLLLTVDNAAWGDAYSVASTYIGTGTVYIRLTNISAGSRSDGVPINFAVIKGAAA